MALKLYNLKPARGAKKKKKRIGRGDSSGHGTYATRGMKGQRSRSGGKGGLKLKGLKANIQNLPKIGGFKSSNPKLAIVNLQDLETQFKDNDIITPGILLEKKLIRTTKPGVKVLGLGKLSKKLIIKANKFSESAKKAIESAGGQAISLSSQPKTQEKDKGKETQEPKEAKKKESNKKVKAKK